MVTVTAASPGRSDSTSSDFLFFKVNGKHRGFEIGREPDFNMALLLPKCVTLSNSPDLSVT